MSWKTTILVSSVVLIASCSGGATATSDSVDPKAIIMDTLDTIGMGEYEQRSCASLFSKLDSMERRETDIELASKNGDDDPSRLKKALSVFKKSDESLDAEKAELKEQKKLVKKAIKSKDCAP